MKIFNFFSMLLLAVFLLFSCGKDSPVSSVQNQPEVNSKLLKAGPNAIPGQYIVVLEDNKLSHAQMNDASALSALVSSLAGKHNATVQHTYDVALRGFAAKMSQAAAEEMAEEAVVEFIEPDGIVTLDYEVVKDAAPVNTDGAQVVPWGIRRVGGSSSGSGKTAWILDTGIDFSNPNLNVDRGRSKDFTGSGSANDQHGHGTHVAGTVAAQGSIVGVAAGAKVVAVRVLDAGGSGNVSGFIAGVNYVASSARGGDAANMSIRSSPSTSLDRAVQGASTNCRFTLSAGNRSRHANSQSPARANGSNIYTISAFGRDGCLASFSNHGNPPIDWSAPGVGILSTALGGGTTTMSGTSMAAPHACGLLLVGSIRADGYICGDRDGTPDPIAHR